MNQPVSLLEKSGLADRLEEELKTSMTKRSKNRFKGATPPVAIIAAIAVIAAIAAITAVVVFYFLSSKDLGESQAKRTSTKSEAVSTAVSTDEPAKPNDTVESQQPKLTDGNPTDVKDEFQIDPNTLLPKEIKAAQGGYVLTAIPGGKFPLGVNSEFASHSVTIKNFYLGKYEVTNKEYALFLKDNPDVEKPAYWTDEGYNRPKQPVVGVTWDEAKKYCDWAGLRLPSEAEWEWAARAGTRTYFSNGNMEDDLDKVAWFGGNSDSLLHVVGEKNPNPFGLFDTLGNAWEWVEDDYHPNYNGAPTDGSAWLDTPRAEKRVVRGGSFIYSSDNCRTAYRGLWGVDARDYGLGFRPAKSAP
jgi:formylglycine-generating enzyme required for sulfatase activity